MLFRSVLARPHGFRPAEYAPEPQVAHSSAILRSVPCVRSFLPTLERKLTLNASAATSPRQPSQPHPSPLPPLPLPPPVSLASANPQLHRQHQTLSPQRRTKIQTRRTTNPGPSEPTACGQRRLPRRSKGTSSAMQIVRMRMGSRRPCRAWWCRMRRARRTGRGR